MTATATTRTLTAALSLALAAGTALTAGTAHADTAPQVPAPAPAAAPAAAPAPAPAQPQAAKPSQVTAGDLLKVARTQVGVEENADGGGTKFHKWYMKSQRAQETVERDGGSVRAYADAPWCAMFVSWVGERTGMRATVGWDAYTVTYAEWFEANGTWGQKATPGAVVFFDWEQGGDLSGIDHVGLVKKDNGDGTISTIEGNTGNGKVEERVRPKSQVTGYGYPQYAS
ncbi:CHAP domain-containing protein [Planomonospora sp. ID82291]|uniref:CHAP domain-containing protein n=1 Tax=Planomonospora sp. ID82291 TaxID=2738136 RepID=UPI0018C3C518|nr:CHAP domain-containing protein [Planomonospora sp. ID82291]MBG0818510.1 CHAP domain-containing protein [Planomonospora sp. ID82291]